MPYSCSAPYVSRNYVDTTVPQLIADLCSGLLIEVSVGLVAAATVDGCRMLGDLLIAFARIGRPQFVETLEVVRMENLPCGANDYLLEIEVAFIRCKQVAATVRRDLKGECQCVEDVLIHRGAEAPDRPPLVPSWMLILPSCSASRCSRGRSAKIASRKRIQVARANCAMEAARDC